MAQQNVCVRCCEPLEEDQARFNHLYWGMAHRKCSADAVWPPQFRPSLDPNEVMRQIAALVAHLAKISTGLPISQILPNRSFGAPPRRSVVERPGMSVATPPVVLETPVAREEKDELGVESLANSPPEDARAEARHQGRERSGPQPRQKPHLHPSSRRPNMATDEAPVQQQQTADKPNPPPPSPKQSPKGSRKKSDSTSTGINVTNLNTLREYNLQKAVQTAKGKFVTVDPDNKYLQWHEKCVSDEWSRVGEVGEGHWQLDVRGLSESLATGGRYVRDLQMLLRRLGGSW